MLHVLRLFFCMLFLSIFSACTHFNFDMNWAKPTSLNLEPPPGPPEYQQGYVDGCHSGWKGYATQFNKFWGKYRQDPELAQNPVYYQIWKDAYAFCSAYAMTTGETGLQEIDGNDKTGILGVFGTMGEAPLTWEPGIF